MPLTIPFSYTLFQKWIDTHPAFSHQLPLGVSSSLSSGDSPSSILPTSNLIENGILKELTAAGEGVGHIKSESIRYGLNMSIEGVIEVYKSIVEGNV